MQYLEGSDLSGYIDKYSGILSEMHYLGRTVLEYASDHGWSLGRPSSTKGVQEMYRFARDEFEPVHTKSGKKRRVSSLVWRSAGRLHCEAKKKSRLQNENE